MARSRTTVGKGNKLAEKWTEATVLPILEKMWKDLSSDDDGEPSKNPIRANDVKTLGEICLMHDVTYDQWEYWKEKFRDVEPVSRIFKKIEWVLENRLIYSGQFMDIFVLKNKYGYADKKEVDHTTAGEKMKQDTLVFVNADSLTDEQIAKITGNDSGT